MSSCLRGLIAAAILAGSLVAGDKPQVEPVVTFSAKGGRVEVAGTDPPVEHLHGNRFRSQAVGRVADPDGD